MTAIQYLIISSVCLVVFYGFYRLIFRKESGFNQLRFYLLASIILSLTLPFSNFKIGFDINKNSEVLNTSLVQKSISVDQRFSFSELADNFSNLENVSKSKNNTTHWTDVITNIYFTVLLILIARLLLQVLVLFYEFYRSPKVKEKGFIIISSTKFRNSFSFFKWVFINKEYTSPEDTEQIISHEKIHASQYHTLDLILVEMLATVMWFNPVVWMMRNSIHLVHEYLADYGVLKTGIDRFRYQVLLLNQVAEEKLICLSSSFSHSLIKKRIIMMTKSKLKTSSKLKILALLPLVAILLFGVACIKGGDKSNAVTAVELVKMNVLYLGVENPVKIAVSGYETSEIDVSINNGTISGSNGEYLVLPKESGSATILISSKGKEIQKMQLRVKVVPDPIVLIKTLKGELPVSITGGPISKTDLLNAGGISVEMRNFDFDLEFKIISFEISGIFVIDKGAFEETEYSKSDRFTEKQISLIGRLVKDQKFYIENIISIGPDGKERKLNSVVFKISEE
jgi:hypothetical protein